MQGARVGEGQRVHGGLHAATRQRGVRGRGRRQVAQPHRLREGAVAEAARRELLGVAGGDGVRREAAALGGGGAGGAGGQWLQLRQAALHVGRGVGVGVGVGVLGDRRAVLRVGVAVRVVVVGERGGTRVRGLVVLRVGEGARRVGHGRGVREDVILTAAHVAGGVHVKTRVVALGRVRPLLHHVERVIRIVRLGVSTGDPRRTTPSVDGERATACTDCRNLKPSSKERDSWRGTVSFFPIPGFPYPSTRQIEKIHGLGVIEVVVRRSTHVHGRHDYDSHAYPNPTMIIVTGERALRIESLRRLSS